VSQPSMLRTGAGLVAGTEAAPTSVRAVLGYYADTGAFDWRSLRLKRRVDAVTGAMIADTFAAVEERLAAEFDADDPTFAYDTKLVLPAQLTLGYQYRHLDETDHERAEALTRLAVEALVDGDMRDAINDDEFEDFETDVATGPGDRRRVAELAQATLRRRVEDRFSEYSEGVRGAYEWAVDVSEAHQDEDDHFRALVAAARGTGDTAPAEARERVREEYRDATFEDPPDRFTDGERAIPYFKTQYDRVGVIYEGMIEMYCRAGLPVADAFRTSVVLAIIGAQVWLDDVDDYAADLREGQLTPVTAEYLLADTDREAYDRVVGVAERYLDRAIDRATDAGSPLTGVATEYIYYSGQPGVLPGSAD